ncbi:MAG TPA: hypothetical protein VHT74_15760 [Acetobacteraceae bacterium]|nr:hypothetical protein [Acetobacteraceae bacterium]
MASEPTAIIVTEYLIGQSPRFYIAMRKREGRASVARYPLRRRQDGDSPAGGAADAGTKRSGPGRTRPVQKILEMAGRDQRNRLYAVIAGCCAAGTHRLPQ